MVTDANPDYVRVERDPISGRTMVVWRRWSASDDCYSVVKCERVRDSIAGEILAAEWAAVNHLEVIA